MDLRDAIEKRKMNKNHPYNKIAAIGVIILLANGFWAIGMFLRTSIYEHAFSFEILFFIVILLALLIKSILIVKIIKPLKSIIIILYIVNLIIGFSMFVPLIWFAVGTNIILAGYYMLVSYKNIKVIDDDVPAGAVFLRLLTMIVISPIMIAMGLFLIGNALKSLFEIIF